MKVAVIGANGDIGLVVCALLEARGISVVRGTHENCDVASQAKVDSFMGMAWSNGGLDGLVNCHGAPGCIKPSLELTDGELAKILEIDLVGTFRTCRAAGKYMCSQGRGSIVNISSMHAIATYPERAAYAAAKAGVVGLTKALAIEWAKYGVSVNAVLPGQVLETRRTSGLGDMHAILARSPSGALIGRVDAAEAVWFLLRSSGINGHALVVDDGWTSSAWFKSHE